jgi:hypothetical protein
VTRQNKLIVTVAAVAALAALYWFLVLTPKRQEAADLQTKIEAQQQALAESQTTIATYRTARGAYKGNYAKLVRLGKAVPADDDVRSLLVQLDAAAGHSGVDFRTIQVGGSSTTTASTTTTPTPGAPQPPPGAVAFGGAGFSAMPFSFQFRGTFFDLGNFFNRLEHFVTVKNQRIGVTGRLMRVESISLQPDTTGFPRIRAQIGASSYLAPAPTDISGQASTGSGATTPAAAGGSSPTTPTTTTATATGVIR